MSFISRILNKNFFIRLRSWEYWPFWVVQFPLLLYWLWLSIRSRSLLFFSASNPSIVMGGMLGESKYGVLKRVPPQLIPRTIFVEKPLTADQVVLLLKKNELDFPLIFKPDIGERGFMVKRIFSVSDVAKYVKEIKGSFLIQELIDLPVECGVFYTRFPDQPQGKVTSLVFKEMLSVTGDGHSTVQQLILNYERAKLQWERLRLSHDHALEKVLPTGDSLELNSIGNHCLGTKFLNGNEYINDELSTVIDSICKQIGGYYFGRIDLRCASLEDLHKGNVKIMEVNGCGAEPGHIYQPGFSLLAAYGVLFGHWKNIFLISEQNKKLGHTYPSLMEGVRIFKEFRRAMS
ncbi:MAG: hypothetical protein OEU76_05055 [Cyclobacteriaceae bacterium]|nr:hypothetical protein [Cyclobacteriaceae bacterium]